MHDGGLKCVAGESTWLGVDNGCWCVEMGTRGSKWVLVAMLVARNGYWRLKIGPGGSKTGAGGWKWELVAGNKYWRLKNGAGVSKTSTGGWQ